MTLHVPRPRHLQRAAHLFLRNVLAHPLLQEGQRDCSQRAVGDDRRGIRARSTSQGLVPVLVAAWCSVYVHFIHGVTNLGWA